MNSDYVLVSHWTFAVSRDALWNELDDLLATDDPMIWWPSVQISHYDGSTMRVRTSSAFGYALSLTLTGLQVRRPDSLSFDAHGDLDGHGDATFTDLGVDRCGLEIDWRVSTERSWMRRTAWLLRPVFVLGHALVMRQGQRHLSAWLDARGSR